MRLFVAALLGGEDLKTAEDYVVVDALYLAWLIRNKKYIN
jgi:hypothetical protein